MYNALGNSVSCQPYNVWKNGSILTLISDYYFFLIIILYKLCICCYSKHTCRLVISITIPVHASCIYNYYELLIII